MENTFAQNLFQALAPAREAENQRNRRRFIPEFARTRAAFVYVNQSRNYIPSYDMHRSKKRERRGEEDGFYGLLERIIIPAKEKRTYISVLICCKLGDDLRTYIDGRIAMDYNFVLFKHTLNEQPQFCPYMKFDKVTGKLDVEILKRVNPLWYDRSRKGAQQ